MEITSDEILNTIEALYLTYPPIPGKLEYFDIAGIQGWYSPGLSHPLMNLVIKTNLTTENADETIQTVQDQFKAQEKAFGWWVSDLSLPADLGTRLEAAGLAKVVETAGMSLDVHHPISANPAVRVGQVATGDVPIVADLYHRAYPVPKPLAEHRVELWEKMGFMQFFAYVEESEDPVAVASMWYRPGYPIALLGGAATLTEYRGRGIYTALVAQRLKKAIADGMQTAIIAADRSTSAPICKKLGFAEQCSLALYAWTPLDS
ncbi:MAG: GNAT family N-acetyltransferase [Chloroflexota bacterium]